MGLAPREPSGQEPEKPCPNVTLQCSCGIKVDHPSKENPVPSLQGCNYSPPFINSCDWNGAGHYNHCPKFKSVENKCYHPEMCCCPNCREHCLPHNYKGPDYRNKPVDRVEGRYQVDSQWHFERGFESAKQQLEQKLVVAKECLESISKNSCCNPCREAGLWAKQALEKLK